MRSIETAHRIKDLEASFDPTANLIRTGESLCIGQLSLEYAVLMLRRGSVDDRQRAAAVIEAILAAQIQTPAWDRGRFPMRLPESWRDLNATLFMVPYLAEIYTRWLPHLPSGLAVRFQAAVHESVEAVKRRWADEVFDIHRDFKAYSNIFVLYIQALFLLGQFLDDEELRRDGQAQWRRWFNHVSTYGIDEFCSSTYNEVVYEGLMGIMSATSDAHIQADARMVLDHLFALQHAFTHPVLRVGVSGTSRDYRLFVRPGGGAFRFLEHAGDDIYCPPSPIIDEFRRREYPFRASGRAGITPFRFQTWQLSDAAMGSMTGGNYFGQQIHLMAAVGSSPVERSCVFFQADGFNPINGYVSQRDGRALCLFTRTVSSYQLTQLCQYTEDLPSPVTKPPCLGATEGWTMLLNDSGRLILSARGYKFLLRTFAIKNNLLVSSRLTMEKLEAGGQQITGWRADPEVVWLACLAELLPDYEMPVEGTLELQIDGRHLILKESGGLMIRLAQRPSGELVELYNEDWRTLPLFDAPVQRIHSGDLAMASARFKNMT